MHNEVCVCVESGVSECVAHLVRKFVSVTFKTRYITFDTNHWKCVWWWCWCGSSSCERFAAAHPPPNNISLHFTYTMVNICLVLTTTTYISLAVSVRVVYVCSISSYNNVMCNL